MALKTPAPLAFHASDRALEKGFDRLKQQALFWVFEGYPVGDYYEAALPMRDAFCMRDTSHQAIGAQVLGLGRHNLNMVRKFAAALDPCRDYCSYWEIDRYDRPCPVDYTNDADFWYNLPANFDLVDAIWRLYRFSGDENYLYDGAIARFCAQSMEEYVRAWDRDGDGIPDRDPKAGRRGIGSYDESSESFTSVKVGSDLVASMIRAYASYARMCECRHQREAARIYEKRGQALKARLEQDWYREGRGYASALSQENEYLFHGSGEMTLLYWGVAEGERAQPILDEISHGYEDMIIERFSHVPEILWKYGRNDAALAALRRAMRPDLPRREYPEASFCAIGALATGLMGLEPDVISGRVATLSRLPRGAWAALEHASALDGCCSVEHGDGESTFINEGTRPVLWRARFLAPGAPCVEGMEFAGGEEVLPFSREIVRFAEVTVPAGASARAFLRPQ